MTHPRSACGAFPSRGRPPRPGKAGCAVALERFAGECARIAPVAALENL
jgi:hypothetical protein